MPKQIVEIASAPTVGLTPGQTVSPLAQAVRFGNMLLVSGHGAVDPATGAVVAGDITRQTRLALENLMAVLAAAGATARNIVNMRVTLSNIGDFAGFSDALRDHFRDEKITLTCFGGIPNRAGVDVQIDCVAMFD